MIRLTKYHDHIVNLQGLTYTSDKENKCISSVSHQIVINSSNSFMRKLNYIFKHINVSMVFLILKILFQVSLLLEYCCKGELRSFLIRHRLEIEKSLTLYINSGFFESTKSKSARNVILDVKILYRWVYQVYDRFTYKLKYL